MLSLNLFILVIKLNYFLTTLALFHHWGGVESFCIL